MCKVAIRVSSLKLVHQSDMRISIKVFGLDPILIIISLGIELLGCHASWPMPQPNNEPGPEATALHCSMWYSSSQIGSTILTRCSIKGKGLLCFLSRLPYFLLVGRLDELAVSGFSGIPQNGAPVCSYHPTVLD